MSQPITARAASAPRRTALDGAGRAGAARRFATETQRWAACQRRDRAADGHFLYGVLTTGVFCRPSCGARRPRRDNVRFYDDPEAARRAGLRACRRCRPDGAGELERQAALIERACRRIERAASPPRLDALAREAGLSRFHFHRLFKRVTGLTPGEYRSAQRAARVRAGLRAARSVTAALYDAGYGSNGRFYAASAGALGMNARAYRRGGQGSMIRFALGRCSLGEILVAATSRGVCAILLGDDPQALLRDLQERFARARLIGGDRQFERLVAQVIAAVERPELGAALPLDLQGTAFQHRVWQALRAVPAGSTVSYAQIAQRLGVPRAVRAVGQAIAANPLAVVVPCHRVIRSDGSLSGYRWGVQRKQRLLELERAAGPKPSGPQGAQPPTTEP